MKIKKVENKEKPEYDTKSEKQNKFLKLIFEHKKITITLVVLIILTCSAFRNSILEFTTSCWSITNGFSSLQ